MTDQQPKSFYARYSLGIMAVCLFLLPFAAIGSIRAKQANKNDVRNWIPQEYEETKIYGDFRKQFQGEEFMLVSWDSCNSSNSRMEDLALKLVPPLTVYFTNSNSDEGQTAPDLELAKIDIEQHFAKQAQESALQLGKPVTEVKLYYGEWNKIGNQREELLVFDDPKAEGNPAQPNRELAVARLVRNQNHYFKSVLNGQRVLRQITARNPGFSEEDAAAKLGGYLYAPEFVLRQGLTLVVDGERIPLNGEHVDIVAGFVQVNDQDLLHKGKPVAVTGRKLHVESTPVHKFDLDGNPLDPVTGQVLAEDQIASIGLKLRQSCVVVTLTEAGLKDKKAALDELRRVATNECQLSAEQLHIGGPPVDNVSIDAAGNKSLNMLAGVAVIIGFIVSWFSLKSLKLVMIVISAGIYSSILSLAVVWYVGAPVDAILFTMPSLVYVATTSGAIHLSNYYRDVRMEGHPAAGAGGAALHHAALPLALATGTTAFGLATLCYTELVPIKNFGLFSSIGVLVSALLLVFYIPAALELWQPAIRKPDNQPLRENETHTHINEQGFWWRMGQLILQRNGWATAACLLMMGVLGYGVYYGQTSVQLMRLLSPREQLLKDYAYLEQKLGPLVPMEIVLRIPKPSDEQSTQSLRFIDRLRLVRDIQDSVKTIPEVGGSTSTLTFMEDVDDLVEKNHKRLIGGKATTEGTVNRQLLRHRELLLKHGDYLREQPGTAGSPVEVWRISARVSALKNVDYAKFIENLKQHVEPVVANFLTERDRSGPVQNAIASTLPAWMDKRDFRDQIHVEYTGVVPLVYKAQHSLIDGLVFGLITDFALIVIVMIVACRDWSAGLVLLLPSAFPALVVFGSMGWLHQFLQSRGWGDLFIDIGYVMAPSVALGVTVDDVVHFMLWFRKGITEGMNRKQAVELAYRGCARAMYQSWGVIGIGLSVFALSPFMPTRNFGIMMISMLTVALVGNLVMMPAMLAGPGGSLFAWGILKRENRRRLKLGLPVLTAGQSFDTDTESTAVVHQPTLAVIADEPEDSLVAELVPVVDNSTTATTIAAESEVESEPMTVPMPKLLQNDAIPEPHLRHQETLRRNFRRK